MKLTKILFIPFILLFTSCEDVVQIKLDEGSKLYVIDAFVNNLRNDQLVRITTNDSYFSNREAPGVENAIVTLTDLNTYVSYSFNHTTKGKYVYALGTADTIGRVGHKYLLRVTINGDTYTSIAEQKRLAAVDSISAVVDESPNAPTGPNKRFTCLLFARDKADNVADYYWIRTYRNDTLFNEPGDLNINIDGTGGVVNDSPVDTIDFTPPSTFLGFKSYRANDVCKVEVHAVTRDTYFFFFQAIAQINNGGLFATTPENVKTNISTPDGAKLRSIGWFSMSGAVMKSKVVQ
jgi:hypothetical protein